MNKETFIKDTLKIIDEASVRINRYQFLSDLFECGAITISNRFDLRQAEKREERYLAIVKNYDKQTQELLAKAFTNIYLVLTKQIDIGFYDYLGQLYMESNTSNSQAGQFFTPYHISKTMAQLSIGETDIQRYKDTDEILTANDSACGAGGTIIALADVLYNEYDFNISRNLCIECSDIDSRCVHMCYLQLGLAGIPATIYRQNALTLETWERWDTPAYIMQYTRFRNCFK